MTASERFEQRLPELMAELAPARVPDYFDDMLRQTARTRQRPAWSSLERWLPMGVLARSAPVRLPAWRPILALVIIGLLVAATAMLIVGSRPRQLPAPFGPARNGDLLVGTPNGEILALDPATGRTTPIVTGTDTDRSPPFSPDGTRILFSRVSGEGTALMVSNADGSGLRQVQAPGKLGRWIEWSPTGDRIVMSGFDLTDPAQVIDVATGSSTTLATGFEVQQALGRPGHEQLVITGVQAGKHGFWLVNPDGTGLRQIGTPPYAINTPSLSPDGTRPTYATWEDGLGTGGNLRVLEIDTGKDSLATSNGNETHLWQMPQFMPDGDRIVALRRAADGTFQLSVVATDGTGSERAIGPFRIQDSGGATATVSPDGTTDLASYRDNGVEDGTMWSIDVASGTGTDLPWPDPEAMSWQRLAP